MNKLIVLVLLVAACGRHQAHNPPPTPNEVLSDMRATYLSLIPEVQDSYGFVDTNACDSLLHTGLLGAGGVPIADIKAAQNSDGQWFRRPLTDPECLKSGGANSTLSRDMVIGLMWYWYATKDVADAEAFYDYAQARSLKFGESDGSADGASKIYMTPDLMSLLAELIYRLGGTNHSVVRQAAVRDAANLIGFQAHLETLTTILWAKLTNTHSTAEVANIAYNVAREPNNALFQYAADNVDQATSLLISSNPADRLPNNTDYCDPLQYETDSNPPCPNADGSIQQWAPTHFMFVSQLILQ